MKQKIKKAVCLISAASILVGAFSGCNSTKNECSERVESKEDDVIEAKAEAVNYNSNGKYTTELTVENAKFTGVESKDIRVAYGAVDKEGLNKAIEENSGDESKVDYEKYQNIVDAEITDVKVESDTKMVLSFLDEKAAENITSGYSVYIENQKIAAAVEVKFNDFTLTPEVEYVLASDEDTRLTLNLNEGEFSEDISKENITLGGSFKKMEIESLSAAGKNLTMQLKGKPTMVDSAGIYVDGSVTADKKCIANATADVTAKVPVQTEVYQFESDKISVNGSTVTVPLTLIDVVDIDSLTKDSFSFEKSVTVTDCKKDSDTQVTLTMTVDGSADKNSAAAILNDQKVKIRDSFEFTADFVSANFYPVFDYVEQDGDNLKFTLKLYSNSGIFADKLEKNMFTFGKDFEGAQVVSVERTGDSTAELVITVPAKGQTTENLNMDGEVVMAAGSLINRWGDAASEKSVSFRNYAQDSMGKAISAETLDALKKAVSGVGSFVGKATTVVKGVEVAKTLLELTGVIESDQEELLKNFKEISDKIDSVQSTLDKHTQMIEDLKIDLANLSLDGYNTSLSDLETYIKYVKGYFVDAAKKTVSPDSKELKYKEPGKDASDEEWKAYGEALLAEIASNKAVYDELKSDFDDLKKLFVSVTNKLAKTDNNNPLYIFDSICAKTYNFDTTAYPARTAYRIKSEKAINDALNLIMLYYNCLSQTEQCTVSIENYNAAKKQLVERGDIAKPEDEKIYFYVIDKHINNSLWTSSSKYQYLTDSQKKEFEKRLKGKTLKEEFANAGVKSENKTKGVRLGEGELKYDGSWNLWPFLHYSNEYADVIEWDKNKITYKLKIWSQEDGYTCALDYWTEVE